jgi:hypothetical protein
MQKTAIIIGTVLVLATAAIWVRGTFLAASQADGDRTGAIMKGASAPMAPFDLMRKLDRELPNLEPDSPI